MIKTEFIILFRNFLGDHMGAHLTLRNLAGMEQKSVEKKKTFLSLSKLAAAFSGEDKAVIDEQIEGN